MKVCKVKDMGFLSISNHSLHRIYEENDPSQKIVCIAYTSMTQRFPMEGRRKYQGRRGYTLYKNGPFWHAFLWILHLHTFVAHVHRTYQKKKIISDMFLIWNTLFWGPILCNFQISNREGNSLNAPRLKTRWNTKSFKTLTCPIVLKICRSTSKTSKKPKSSK